VIRHVVIVGLTSECTDAQADEFIDAVRALEGVVPEIRAVSIGRSLGSDGSLTRDIALVVDVDGLAELTAYLTHPAHVAVGALVASIKQTATAADFEIASH
jgi:hypothetical protein